MIVPDINVWLALAFDQHQNYISARAWFDGLPGESRCYFCRYTQLGFLRLSTNPRANPFQTQTLRQAWTLYDNTLLDPRIAYAAEPDGLDGFWRRWTQFGTFSHNVWNDAYLAAFAIAGGFEIVTFDRGFAQYKSLRQTILS